jgi:hypothetical protein
MVQKGLPKVIEALIAAGIPDPQILFLGIGDHECDDYPLQVGQFESGDEELDHWLTNVYLEGGGGGNSGESYLLAWMFAARHTSIDCFEKRGRKGYLFTIGDEPTLSAVDSSTIKRLMGNGQHSPTTASQFLDQAQSTYNVFHINVCSTSSGRRSLVRDHWTQMLNENALMAQSPESIANIIVHAILEGEKCIADHAPAQDPTDVVSPITPEETL